MIEIAFKKLVIEDFKVFKGQHVLDFEALGNGVHFVTGSNLVQKELKSNGAGKSSLFDALHWCLKGTTVRGLRNADVKPKGTSLVPHVSVTITRNAKEWVISRKAKTNGLLVNGKVCAQSRVDKLIPPNLLQTILLGQRRPMFFDLKPKEKLDVLSEALNLERWDAYSVRARRLMVENKTKANDAAIRCEGLSEQLETVRASIKVLKRDRDNWDAENDQRMTNAEQEIEELEKKLNDKRNALGKLDLDFDWSETEIKALKRSIDNKREAETSLIKRKLTAKNSFDQVQARVRELKSMLKRSNSVCPTCGQKIKRGSNEHHVSKLKDELADQTEELEQLRVALRNRKNELATVHDEIEVLKFSLILFEKKSVEAKDKHYRAEREVASVEAKLAEAKKALKRGEQESNPFSAQLKRAIKQREKVKADIVVQKETHDRANRRAERFKYWIDGFKNIRLITLTETLKELELTIAEMLPALGMHDWSIAIEIEKETKSGSAVPGIDVVISERTSEPVKWESWSGGEGQRLRVIGALALSRVLLARAGVKCDLLILDEPSAHIAREGVESLVEMLADYFSNRQIFFVDHMAIASGRFASIVHVRRRDQGSDIELKPI